MLGVVIEELGGLSRVASGCGRGTEVGMWFGGGGVLSWVGDGCGPRSGRYLTRKDVPSDGASLEIISIWSLSKRCGFFSAQERSDGGRTIWG